MEWWGGILQAQFLLNLYIFVYSPKYKLVGQITLFLNCKLQDQLYECAPCCQCLFTLFVKKTNIWLKRFLSMECVCVRACALPHQCCAAICWCFQSSWRWWCRRPAWCPWLLCSRRWWWCGTVPGPLCPCTHTHTDLVRSMTQRLLHKVPIFLTSPRKTLI